MKYKYRIVHYTEIVYLTFWKRVPIYKIRLQMKCRRGFLFFRWNGWVTNKVSSADRLTIDNWRGVYNIVNEIFID
jgi:hypothetical protein